MSKINSAIIDYNMGNLYGLKCALDHVGFENKITNNSSYIKNARILFLPGVGSFNQAIRNLKKLKIYDYIIEHNDKKRTIIGICLGMQILFGEGDEGEKTSGLNLLSGKVNKLFSKGQNKLNVGWKNIKNKKNLVFNKINCTEKFYFIHSYGVIPEDKKIITSSSEFNGKYFCSSVEKKNIFGFQFHPEKSSKQGITLLKNLKKRIYEKHI